MDPAAAVDHLQQPLAAVQSQLQNLSLQDQVIQNLQNQVQALAAQPLPQAVPVPVAPVAPAASAVPTLKPAKPDTFSNVRSSGRPEAWLFTIETYFEATGINDPQRVTFVATLLRGAAHFGGSPTCAPCPTVRLLASLPGLLSQLLCWSSLHLWATLGKHATAYAT